MARSNLPLFPTPFVGRQAELADIARLLAEPNCRLLTLLGPGGIGKTRLAIEAARLQEADFADAIGFVALQPLRSPDLLIAAIADALGLRFYPGGEPKQQLFDALRDQRLLLVLDNFEHLLEGAAFVSELLSAAPHIRVLTTSRERLNLVEEWTVDVTGLAVPRTGGNDPIEDYDAVRLFVQSATRVQANFDLAEPQRAAVLRICQLVGGMPLGLEMAAAWVRALSCDQIAAELERGMDILTTSARNVSPRHRSMRAALDHSWSLLTPLEQHDFQWLSVFRGGFTLEAATFVSGASVWTLTALVDKSLLRVDGQGRYQVQELLRQYAEEQLVQRNELLAAHDRHATYYVDFLRQRWYTLRSRQQRHALDDIDAELDNIRLAWHTLCEQRRAADLHAAAPSLWLANDLRCRFTDMVTLFGEGVAALRSETPTAQVSRALGLLLALQGWSHVGFGLPAKGKTLAEEGVALLDDAEPTEDNYLALLCLQLTLIYLDLPDEIQRVSEKAVAAAQQIGLDWGVARSSYELGNYMLGRVEFPDVSEAERQARCAESERIAETCLQLAEACGDVWLRASVSGFFYSNIHHVSGKHAEALRRLEQSLPLFEEVGQTWAIGAIHRLIATTSETLNDQASALQHFIMSIDVYNRNGQIHELLTSLQLLNEWLIRQGDTLRAVQLATVTAHHPANLEFMRQHSHYLLQKMEARLPTDQYRAAVERGRMTSLEEAVASVLALQAQAPQPLLEVRTPTIDALTKRELEILHLIASGMNNREIADQLTLSVGTVKWYGSQILSKLHAQNRTQAVAQARALDLLP